MIIYNWAGLSGLKAYYYPSTKDECEEVVEFVTKVNDIFSTHLNCCVRVRVSGTSSPVFLGQYSKELWRPIKSGERGKNFRNVKM